VKLVWSPLALADREAIFKHIQEQSPLGADAVDQRIEVAAGRLLPFPQSGRPGRVPGTRELVIQRTPFIAAYTLSSDTVYILRVLHGAQRWPAKFSVDSDQ
jgi:toxin ParE1/3/4